MVKKRKPLRLKSKVTKRNHAAHAKRVAIMNQIIIDSVEFDESTIMRCWDCQSVYSDELKKIDKQLGIKFADDVKTLRDHIKKKKLLNYWRLKQVVT